MKIFFDTEFTGLHQNTTLISIGLVAENGHQFYGELTDYDHGQIDGWLQSNVIGKLYANSHDYQVAQITMPDYYHVGDSDQMRAWLLDWFEQFDIVELWSDCLSFDWVLLSELIADRPNGYPIYPDNFVYHSPFDLLTLFEIKGQDYDVNREKFAFGTFLSEMRDKKHNALWDAKVIKQCYEKLIKLSG